MQNMRLLSVSGTVSYVIYSAISVARHNRKYRPPEAMEWGTGWPLLPVLLLLLWISLTPIFLSLFVSPLISVP